MEPVEEEDARTSQEEEEESKEVNVEDKPKKDDNKQELKKVDGSQMFILSFGWLMIFLVVCFAVAVSFGQYVYDIYLIQS